jgi:hypothetical protein
MPCNSKTVQQLTPQTVVYCLRVFGDRIVNREFWSPSFASYKTKQFLCLLKDRVISNNCISDGDVKKGI